jgi:hypothetical protein
LVPSHELNDHEDIFITPEFVALITGLPLKGMDAEAWEPAHPFYP